MSLPGVESARRRRASHGSRSCPALIVHPNIRLSKLVAPPRNPNRPAETSSGQDIEAGGASLHAQAMAARHRLDDKLRAGVQASTSARRNFNPDSSWAQRQITENEMSSSSLHSRGTYLPPWANRATTTRSAGTASMSRLAHKKEGIERLSCWLRMEYLSTELVLGDSGQEECPVCLDSFLAGQLIMYLPCNHRFHSPCLLPWLQRHSHCPFCRAEIAPPTKAPSLAL